ncbi:MAG: oligosaccharide flippase family protein [Syntrophobacterales bacterium]|jgi:O-antigen/teichoic acid export membrane protein
MNLRPCPRLPSAQLFSDTAEFEPMEFTTSLRQRLAADSTLALGIKVISLPLAYLTSLAMARFWGAQGLGTYSLAVYLVTILAVVCRLGLDTGMLRFGAKLKAAGQAQDLPGLFWQGLAQVLGLSTLVALALFLARSWLAQVFHAPALPEVLSPVSLALPILVAAAFCGESLRSLGGVRWVVTQQDFLTPLSLLLLVAIWAWVGQDSAKSPAALGLAYLLSGALGLGFLAIFLRSRLPGSLDRAGGVRLGELLRYSWPLYLSVLLLAAFGAVDSLVLGLFTTPQEVAYYEAAGRSALLVSLPLMAINAAVPPLFAELHHQGRLLELERLARASTRWMYYVALPLALVLVALSPEVLGLFGVGFVNARWALLVLVLAQLVNVACGSVGFLLAMTGHQATLTRTLALGSGLGLPLMVAGAALWGLTGLAVAKGVWLVGINLLMSLGVWRCLSFKVYATGVGWATIYGILGLGLFWLARPYLGPWVAAALGGLAYLLLITRTLYQEFANLRLLTLREASR